MLSSILCECHVRTTLSVVVQKTCWLVSTNSNMPPKLASDDANRKAEVERAELAALGCRFLANLVLGLFIVIVGVGMLPLFPLGKVVGIFIALFGVEMMRSEP